MARIVKEEQYTAKSNDILDAVQRLIYTVGYERMTIQDILNELRISKGAFYHYFDSKPAVMEAFIKRILEESEKPILPIIDDSHLSALEKLQRFFGTLDRLRIAHKADVIELLRVWYTDENAIVRQKVEAATVESRARLLAQIIHQGVQEGTFTTAYPEQAGEVILSLLQGMGNTHSRLLLALGQEDDKLCASERIVATHGAYMTAVERVLGLPPHSLYRMEDYAEAVKLWVTALSVSGEGF